MYPSLQLGPISLSSYRLLYALGFILAFLYASRRGDRAGIETAKANTCLVLTLVAGLLGSRLLDLVIHWPSSFGEAVERLKVWGPGTSLWYGGFLGAALAVIAYSYWAGLPVAKICDIAAPSVAIGQIFGRLGCFLAGCCYGRAGDLPWCMVVPDISPVVPRHPTQLYDVVTMSAVLLVLHRFYDRKGRPEGAVMVLYLYLYATLRFLCEFLRDDDRGAFVFGLLSTSQWIGLAVLIAAALVHRRLLRQTGRPVFRGTSAQEG